MHILHQITEQKFDTFLMKRIWLYFSQKEKLKCQMEYMESVKQLEEKMLQNQLKQGSNGLIDGRGNGEV